MTPPDPLARPRRELAAARHLAAGGFHAQAISRAYYAAFYAAEVALLELGETRSKHSGVIAAFVELLVKRGELGPESGKVLRSLFDRRSGADYDLADAPDRAEGERAIADAEGFVDAIGAWLIGRRS
jgi:uncharacterized protein (UPF0332 family)